jgi:integrase
MARGSISHRKDRPRSWQARFIAPDGREHSKTFLRKGDAQEWLRHQMTLADRGELPTRNEPKIPFGVWAGSWLDGLVDLKPKTRYGYQGLLTSRILPTFGRVQLRNVTPARIRSWVREMEAAGLSPSRIRQATRVLSAALEMAVTDGILTKNPARGVKVPKMRNRDQLFLTAVELDTLARACEDRQPGAGALVALLGSVGLRWGEAVALRPSAVDLEKRRIRVREAATEIGGKLEWGTPKTHETRTVAMLGYTLESLTPHLDAGAGDGLVFTDLRGRPMMNSAFRRGVWLPAVRDAAAPEGLRVHDLRHTAASLWIKSGANIKVVQRQLGHATASMTLDRYGHLYEDSLDEAADLTDRRIAAELEAGNVIPFRRGEAR